MTKAAKTRQFIVEQSAVIFNKRGVSGTSISDLMAATKLAKGGIYGNFDSKEQISLEVFKYLSDRVAKGLEKAIANKSAAKEKLFALLDYYELYGPLSPIGGCPLLNFGTEADDTNPEIRQRVAKSVRSSQQRISRLIEEGRMNKEYRCSVDADTLSLKIFALIEGAIFISRVTKSKTAMKTVIELLKDEVRAL
jgi:TetR/AcrR family transcriptional regulator, transcriptional repressor for nem operon